MTASLRLSPVDHIFTGRGAYPINFLFFFDAPLDEIKLRDSLDKTIAIFPHCGSELFALDSKTLGFHPKNRYRWHTQKLSSRIEKDDIHSLGEIVSSAKSVPGEPLLHVTLTQTATNSFLGVSLSHCVVDGYSYFMFLNAWASLVRGEKPSNPTLNRNLLVPEKTLSDLDPKNFDDKEVKRRTGFSLSEIPRPGDEATVQWEIIDIPKAELDQLYSDTSRQSPLRLSLNDVLSAELWKRFAKKNQKSGEMLTFSCAFDYRRILPRVGPHYFGNAIRAASFELEVSQLLDSSLTQVAAQINQSVKSIDSAAVEESLICLENFRNQKGLEAMERFHVADPHTGFLVTNLSRLPLHLLNFGSGSPSDFRILTPAKRTAVILPHPNGLRVQIAI